MAGQSEIVKAALRFRRELVLGNDKALRQMTGAYGESWRRLKAQLDQVTALIREAEALGKEPTLRPPGSGIRLKPDQYSINWLSRQARYQQLMYQAEVELQRYTRQAAAMVGLQQEFGLNSGRETARRLLELSGEDGLIRRTWNEVPRLPLLNLVGVLQDGSPLSYKFEGLAQATVQAIKDTFAAGLAQGWNPRKIARTIRREYHGALSNTLTVCRTETLRAYRTATQATYRANSDIVDGWIWLAAKQVRTCAACWGMDGTLHPLSEEFVDHPNGRCTQIPHLRSGGAQPWDAEEKFRRLSEADQLRVLGPKKFEAWKAGELTLRDIPVRERSKAWGDHWRIRTLKELEAEGKLPTASGGSGSRPPGPPPTGQGAGSGDGEGGWTRFDNATQARAWGDEHFSRLGSQLTAKEREAVSYYQAHGYRSVNNAVLRRLPDNEGEPWSDDQMQTGKKAVALIEAALQKATLPTNTILHRGLALEDVIPDWESATGYVFRDEGFVSSSLIESAARQFAARVEERGGTPLLAEVRVSKGIHCCYPRHATGMENREEEIILPRNAIFRIMESRVEPDGFHRIVVSLEYD